MYKDLAQFNDLEYIKRYVIVFVNYKLLQKNSRNLFILRKNNKVSFDKYK